MHGCDTGTRSRAILPNLSNAALNVLTVPHTSAAEERVFSIIRKNKTEFRSRFDVTSLNAIMVVKMSKPESLLPCYPWKPTKELLKACAEYNEKYSSTASSSQRNETGLTI